MKTANLLIDEEKEIIKEFQQFRKRFTMTTYGKAIRLDEVAQYVLFKLGKYGKTTEIIKNELEENSRK